MQLRFVVCFHCSEGGRGQESGGYIIELPHATRQGWDYYVRIPIEQSQTKTSTESNRLRGHSHGTKANAKAKIFYNVWIFLWSFPIILWFFLRLLSHDVNGSLDFPRIKSAVRLSLHERFLPKLMNILTFLGEERMIWFEWKFMYVCFRVVWYDFKLIIGGSCSFWQNSC